MQLLKVLEEDVGGANVNYSAVELLKSLGLELTARCSYYYPLAKSTEKYKTSVQNAFKGRNYQFDFYYNNTRYGFYIPPIFGWLKNLTFDNDTGIGIANTGYSGSVNVTWHKNDTQLDFAFFDVFTYCLLIDHFEFSVQE
jgi:hypothetical protein